MKAKVIKILTINLVMLLFLSPLRAGTGNEVPSLLKVLELGEAIYYRNLTIIPIYAKEIKDKTDYVTLDEAVKKNYISVTEIDSGRVPQVKVRNNSEYFVYLMCGEILTGCKQNRLVGEEALLRPKGKGILIPVYCVESGRWSSVSNKFETECSAVEPELREMAYDGRSQGAIWDKVAKSLCAMEVNSRTSSYQDLYGSDEFQRRSKDYLERLENIPEFTKDTIGVAVGVGDEIAAIDIFCNNNIFSSLWPKLLKSYVTSALYKEGKTAEVTPQKVKKLLEIVNKTNFNYQNGLDLGETIKAKLPEFTGGGLVYRGRVIHLSILPTKEHHRTKDEPRIPVID